MGCSQTKEIALFSAADRHELTNHLMMVQTVISLICLENEKPALARATVTVTFTTDEIHMNTRTLGGAALEAAKPLSSWMILEEGMSLG